MSASPEHDAIFSRLDRIDSRLDAMQGVLVNLARVEERAVTFNSDLARLENRVDNCEARLRLIERASDGNTRVSRTFERLAWMLVALAFSLVGYKINQ